MRRVLAGSWWMLVLRGIAGLALGVLAIAWPGITLLILVGMFAIYAILSGAIQIGGAAAGTREHGWSLLLLTGIVSVAAGVLAIFYPGLTVVAFVTVMAVYAIFSGALEISMALRLRKEMRGEWLLGLAGTISILFGAIVLFAPAFGAFVLAWLVGLYAIATGVLFVSLGVRLRAHSA